jgi:hypothetical protein
MQDYVVIYGLCDPQTGELKYIGKTCASLARRLSAHLNDVKRGRVYIPRHRWIASLHPDTPEIFEIERVPSSQWQEAEQFWIAYFRSIGCILFNATAGGDGLSSYRHRPDTRIKQSRAAKERYRSQAERAKTGEAVRRGYEVPEARANLRAAIAMRDPEVLVRSAQRLTEFQRSPEGRRRASEIHKGRTPTIETRRKISAAKKGKPLSAEHIRNIANGHRGLRQSAETSAKKSAACDRKLVSERSKRLWASTEFREKQAKANRSGKMTEQWKDPKFRAKMLAAQKKQRDQIDANRQGLGNDGSHASDSIHRGSPADN